MASALISSWSRPLALLTLALTLALALGSLAACGNGAPKSTPGTDPQKEEPTATPYQNYCDGQTPRRGAMKNRAGLASVTEDYVQRVSAVRLKYLDQLMSKPNVVGVAEGYFKDDDGNWIDTAGLIVLIDHRHEVVDQSTLPEADRIPDCLDGVPVLIEKEPVID